MTFRLEFQVKSIHWRNNNMAYITANKFECSNPKIKKKLGRTMFMKGYFNNIFEGDRFVGDVEIREDDTGKKFLFAPTMMRLVIPEKTESLAKFLHKHVKGLSIPKAKMIVDYIGLDCVNEISEDPELLSTVPNLKLSEAKILNIHSQLKYCRNYEECAIFIQSAGLSLYIANLIYDKYKDDTLRIIRENPYQICYDGEISFQVADKLAYECDIPYNQKLRIKTGILSYINSKAIDSGYTCVYKDVGIYKSKENFYDLFNKYLRKVGKIKGRIDDTEIDEAIYELIQDKKVVEEYDTKGKCYLYTAILNSVENSIARYIKKINNRVFKFCETKDVDDFFQNEYQGMPLDSKQVAAIYNTLCGNKHINVLTGGPGTGKTATVNVLVQAIRYICKKVKHKDAMIELLAPTGKAADRMQELTGEPASTIHRRLGLLENMRKSNVIIEADFVIVDESSMIDVFLMEQLLSAMENDTRILFVGDTNQLPSVGPGKVLDDLIASNAIPTVTLTTIFRQSMSSVIVENAHHIINGEDTDHGFKLNEGNFHFIEEHDPVEIKNKAANVINDLYAKGADSKDMIVLPTMKDRDAGTIELNELFQEMFNPNPIEYAFNGKQFKEGDRVMQIKNNYDLNVYNGFVGNIINIREDEGQYFFDVDFDNLTSFIEYNESVIDELELAYATTVHKSQGSEYKYVIIPIHLAQSNMLTSQIFYTAITRAKVEVYVIGEKEAINKAINSRNKNKNEYRISRLAWKIAN